MKKDGVPSETKSHIASPGKRFFIIALLLSWAILTVCVRVQSE
jgi:hypothetical protein